MAAGPETPSPCGFAGRIRHAQGAVQTHADPCVESVDPAEMQQLRGRLAVAEARVAVAEAAASRAQEQASAAQTAERRAVELAFRAHTALAQVAAELATVAAASVPVVNGACDGEPGKDGQAVIRVDTQPSLHKTQVSAMEQVAKLHEAMQQTVGAQAFQQTQVSDEMRVAQLIRSFDEELRRDRRKFQEQHRRTEAELGRLIMQMSRLDDLCVLHEPRDCHCHKKDLPASDGGGMYQPKGKSPSKALPASDGGREARPHADDTLAPAEPTASFVRAAFQQQLQQELPLQPRQSSQPEEFPASDGGSTPTPHTGDTMASVELTASCVPADMQQQQQQQLPPMRFVPVVRGHHRAQAGRSPRFTVNLESGLVSPYQASSPHQLVRGAGAGTPLPPPSPGRSRASSISPRRGGRATTPILQHELPAQHPPCGQPRFTQICAPRPLAGALGCGMQAQAVGAPAVTALVSAGPQMAHKVHAKSTGPQQASPRVRGPESRTPGPPARCGLAAQQLPIRMHSVPATPIGRS